MGSIVFLIVGIIFIGAGIFSYIVIGSAFEGVPAQFGELQSLLQYAVSGVFAGIGVIMAVGGLIGVLRGSKRAKLDKLIAQNGIETEGTVTFVDRNYSLLINNRPIYSIVEYTYQDELGNEYANKIENVATDYVIRAKIEVGGKIKIKYLPEDPGNSIISV